MPTFEGDVSNLTDFRGNCVCYLVPPSYFTPAFVYSFAGSMYRVIYFSRCVYIYIYMSPAKRSTVQN